MLALPLHCAGTPAAPRTPAATESNDYYCSSRRARACCTNTFCCNWLCASDQPDSPEENNEAETPPKAADDHVAPAAASASAGADAAAPATATSDPFTGYADPDYAERLHIVPPERRITPDAIHDPDILEAIFLGLRNNDTFSCNYIARHLGYPEGTRTIFNSPITGKSFWITQAWLRINANVRASGDPRLRTDHPVSGGYRLLFFILRFVHGVPLEHLQALVAKIKATDIPTTFLRPEIQALGLGDATGHMELALWCIEYLDAIPATDGEARNMAMLEVFSPLLSDLNNRKAYPVKTDSYSHCF